MHIECIKCPVITACDYCLCKLVEVVAIRRYVYGPNENDHVDLCADCPPRFYAPAPAPAPGE